MSRLGHPTARAPDGEKAHGYITATGQHNEQTPNEGHTDQPHHPSRIRRRRLAPPCTLRLRPQPRKLRAQRRQLLTQVRVLPASQRRRRPHLARRSHQRPRRAHTRDLLPELLHVAREPVVVRARGRQDPSVLLCGRAAGRGGVRAGRGECEGAVCAPGGGGGGGGWGCVCGVLVSEARRGDEGVDLAVVRVAVVFRWWAAPEEEEGSEADRDEGDAADYTTRDRTGL